MVMASNLASNSDGACKRRHSRNRRNRLAMASNGQEPKRSDASLSGASWPYATNGAFGAFGTEDGSGVTWSDGRRIRCDVTGAPRGKNLRFVHSM